MNEVLTWILTGILILLMVIFILGYLGIIRVDIVSNNRNKIIKAIEKYHKDIIENCYDSSIYNIEDFFLVDYKDIEEFNSTYFRLYDFGYERILPKDKYEIIKPYIEGE